MTHPRLDLTDAPKEFLNLVHVNEAVDFLDDHPEASVVIGVWDVTISSPNFEDCDHEVHDRPFWFDGAVEDFIKNRDGDGWFASWQVG